MVAIVDGTKWIALDPATGRSRGQPIDLGFVPVRPVQHVDLDGDGEPEILAVGPGRAAQQLTLAAFATGTGQQLWVAPIKARSRKPVRPGRRARLAPRGQPRWGWPIRDRGPGLGPDGAR